MLPSATGAGFDDEEMTGEQKRQMEKSIRMTSKDKANAQKALEKRQAIFKKTIQGIAYESKVVQTELREVVGTDELTQVSTRINETSWKWLSTNGKESLSDVSQEEIMKYKDMFSREQWTGLLKTWNIVETRARTTEKNEVDPLEHSLRVARRRLKVATELENLSDEFHTRFDNIFDDVEPIEQEMLTFLDRYNKLEDTSKSYKKHKVYDDDTLVVMLKELLHPGRHSDDDDETKSQVTVSSLAAGSVVAGLEGGGAEAL